MVSTQVDFILSELINRSQIMHGWKQVVKNVVCSVMELYGVEAVALIYFFLTKQREAKHAEEGPSPGIQSVSSVSVERSQFMPVDILI